jgi:hypothetical protein
MKLSEITAHFPFLALRHPTVDLEIWPLIERNLLFKQLTDAEQHQFMAGFLDKLGGHFQGIKAYFTTDAELTNERSRWLGPLSRIGLQKILSTAIFILEGGCNDWLEYAPNPQQFQRALSLIIVVPYHDAGSTVHKLAIAQQPQKMSRVERTDKANKYVKMLRDAIRGHKPLLTGSWKIYETFRDDCYVADDELLKKLGYHATDDVYIREKNYNPRTRCYETENDTQSG